MIVIRLEMVPMKQYNAKVKAANNETARTGRILSMSVEFNVIFGSIVCLLNYNWMIFKGEKCRLRNKLLLRDFLINS